MVGGGRKGHRQEWDGDGRSYHGGGWVAKVGIEREDGIEDLMGEIGGEEK